MTGKGNPEDIWDIDLKALAAYARRQARPTLVKMTLGGDDEARRNDAQMLLSVLQARATLEAAEAGARTARRLVWATWALVAATIALAVVAIWVEG